MNPHDPAPNVPDRVCPTCERRFSSRATAAAPFCSDRCRMADLNRWLEEEHGLPYVDLDAPEEERVDDERF